MAYLLSQIIHCDLSRIKEQKDNTILDTEHGHIAQKDDAYKGCRDKSTGTVQAYTDNPPPQEDDSPLTAIIQLCPWYLDAVSR